MEENKYKKLNENAKITALYLVEMYCGGGFATSRLDYAQMLTMHLRLIKDMYKTDYGTHLDSVNASRKNCIDTLIREINNLINHGN